LSCFPIFLLLFFIAFILSSFLWRRGSVPGYFEPWNPDQGFAYPLKILFRKNPYLAFSLWGPIKHTLVTIVSSLPNPEALAKLANFDEALLIVLKNVVRFFGGTVLPDEFGDTYPVVPTTNWDDATTAALACMLALIF
jgi:hypothetical protein